MAEKQPICTYDEVLEILSAKARSGVTQAAAALERALRRAEKRDEDWEDALARILDE